jgi:hypothetical protein
MLAELDDQAAVAHRLDALHRIDAHIRASSGRMGARRGGLATAPVLGGFSA